MPPHTMAKLAQTATGARVKVALTHSRLYTIHMTLVGKQYITTCVCYLNNKMRINPTI